MKKYCFDEVVDRKSTKNAKWSRMPEQFPGVDENALPLWVADMDLPCADEIMAALKQRLNHPIFGYDDSDNKEYHQTIIDWLNKRFSWNISSDEIFYAPGVVPALGFLIQILSKKGDGILIQTPVYHPFAAKIKANQREVITNSLICDHGIYSIDFEDLQAKMKMKHVKGMILCSPHNPVGRVWKEDELRRIVDIAKTYGKWIISDEIHCDLTRKGYQHFPLAKVGEDYRDQIITCMAPSKTFNLAGMQNSNILIHGELNRKKWISYVHECLSISSCNTLGKEATIAAYRHGESWLSQINEYIDDNFKYLNDFIKRELPKAIITPCEGTYLAWVNFSAYEADDKKLQKRLRVKGNVILNDGFIFGLEGSGYQRINLACPLSILKEALNRICLALSDPME